MIHLHTGGSCPVVSGQGSVIMTSFGPSLGGLPRVLVPRWVAQSFGPSLGGLPSLRKLWSLAGRVAQSAEAMPNFSFCYVTEEKPAVLCTYIV